MSLVLTTVPQRLTELRRITRVISTGASWPLLKHAWYLNAGGSVVGLASVVALSKLFSTTVAASPTPPRWRVRDGASVAIATWWPGARALSDAAARRSIATALVFVLATVAGSQVAERVTNRILRPDAQEWTWIGDVILSTGLIAMTVFWARLRQARDTITALETQRIVLDEQLSIAASVQKALLPSTPSAINGVHWFGQVESAGQVGGDYYDFLPLPDDRMVVVLADISGKGVPAAIFLSNLRAIVHTLVRETSAPDELLGRLSREILSDSRTGLYATCFVAVVDPKSRTMTYSNAGHPPGVLTGPLGVYELRAGGPPVGLLAQAAYDAETIVFGEGEIITLVSDGIAEALDVSAADLPFAVAAEVSSANSPTPQAVCTQLLNATRGSRGPGGIDGWSDDRTVVAFGLVA